MQQGGGTTPPDAINRHINQYNFEDAAMLYHIEFVTNKYTMEVGNRFVNSTCEYDQSKTIDFTNMQIFVCLSGKSFKSNIKGGQNCLPL